MENASKALIIAGAILLAILIISLGLIIYQKAAGTINSVNMSEQEQQAFNGKFTSYEGTSVPGTQVNALIQQVISANASAINDKTGAYVSITFPTASTGNKDFTISVAKDVMTYTDTTSLRKVNTGKKYTVSVQDSNSNGLVDTITVTTNP